MGVLPSTISMVSFANVDEPWSPWMLTKTGAALQDLFTKTSLACLHAVFDSKQVEFNDPSAPEIIDFQILLRA